jgi:hypothetical protein
MQLMHQQFAQFMNKFDNMDGKMSAITGRMDLYESNPISTPRNPEKGAGNPP